METTFNYLLCRQKRDTSPVKDVYVKYAATGAGLATALGAIGYAVNSAKSAVTKENAQYCANLAATMLAEVQRQIQIFNASCVIDDPGANMSMCNTNLLPQPANTSCPDIASTGFGNYVPTIIIALGAATFGLLMTRSIITSYHQRDEQLKKITRDTPDFFEAIENARRNNLNTAEETIPGH
jgi:hypothetical protein